MKGGTSNGVQTEKSKRKMRRGFDGEGEGKMDRREGRKRKRARVGGREE